MKVSARPGSGASRLRHRLTPATSSVAATSSLPRNTCHRNPSLRHPVGASPFPYAGKKARIYTGGNNRRNRRREGMSYGTWYPGTGKPGRGCKVCVIVAATCCSMHVMRKLPVVPICRTSLALRCRANQNDALACLAATRGALRGRHGRRLRDAMDAACHATNDMTRTAKSCGPGAPMQALRS